MHTEIHLRPHHLLCLQTFIGFGYSDDFVAQMKHVKKQLTENPSLPIRLVHGADDLCAFCPNCVNGSCISDKPARFDERVMQKLVRSGVARNDESVEDVQAELCLCGIPQDMKISLALLEECCAGCEWKEETCEKVVCGLLR